MTVYHSQTHPLMEYYDKQGKFTSLKGIGSIDNIFADICKVIDKNRA
jgi:adenylate kinase